MMFQLFGGILFCVFCGLCVFVLLLRIQSIKYQAKRTDRTKIISLQILQDNITINKKSQNIYQSKINIIMLTQHIFMKKDIYTIIKKNYYSQKTVVKKYFFKLKKLLNSSQKMKQMLIYNIFFHNFIILLSTISSILLHLQSNIIQTNQPAQAMLHRRNLFIEQNTTIITKNNYTQSINPVNKPCSIINQIRFQNNNHIFEDNDSDRSYIKFKHLFSDINKNTSPISPINKGNTRFRTKSNQNIFFDQFFKNCINQQRSPLIKQTSEIVQRERFADKKQSHEWIGSPSTPLTRTLSLRNNKVQRQNSIEARKSSMSTLKFKMKKQNKKQTELSQHKNQQQTMNLQQHFQKKEKQTNQIKQQSYKNNQPTKQFQQNIDKNNICKKYIKLTFHSCIINLQLTHPHNNNIPLQQQQPKTKTPTMNYIKKVLSICQNLDYIHKNIQQQIKQFQLYLENRFKQIFHFTSKYYEIEQQQPPKNTQITSNTKDKPTNPINTTPTNQNPNPPSPLIPKISTNDQKNHFPIQPLQHFTILQLQLKKQKYNHHPLDKPLSHLNQKEHQINNCISKKSSFSTNQRGSVSQKFLSNDQQKSIDQYRSQRKHHKSMDGFSSILKNIETGKKFLQLST